MIGTLNINSRSTKFEQLKLRVCEIACPRALRALVPYKNFLVPSCPRALQIFPRALVPYRNFLVPSCPTEISSCPRAL